MRFNLGDGSMKRTTCRIALLSALVTPSLASAGNIDFNVQNQSSTKMCIYCGGPWFRLGFSPVLGNNYPSFFWTLFYTAEDNIFSPFGGWGCGVKTTTDSVGSDCSWVGTLPTQKVEFCVSNRPGVQVYLTIQPNGEVTSNQPSPPCNDAAASGSLGVSTAGQYSQDAYRFAGNAGETVVVTLDRDRTRGSEGEVAKLSLGEEGGAPLKDSVGAVPITVTAKLPKTGTYEITVAYPPAHTPKPFRGYYDLDVTAPNGEPVVLEPINP
jgi:hypothetical protein